MATVTYDFYKNEYLGSLISEVGFPEVMARAEEWIQRLERTYRVEPYGPNSRALAICSAGETMQAAYHRKYLKRQSVGDVNMEFFEQSDRALQRQIFQNVSGYLNIKRGVA